MSCNRFEMLKNFLHFSDNEKIISGDRLGEIAPLLEMLQRKYQETFIPKTVLHAPLKRGQFRIVVLKWKDTRDVRILSTKDAPVMIDVTSHVSANPDQCPNGESSLPLRTKSRQKKAPTKPLAVLAYSKGKPGIELSDQMASHVSCLEEHKMVSKAWY